MSKESRNFQRRFDNAKGWLVKSRVETDESFGKRPTDRSVEELIEKGMVVIDKHSGPTSYQITRWVVDMFDVKKGGHAGTLDPAVTGVLPIALADARKAMPVLLGVDKDYVGVMHLHQKVDESILRKTIEDFIGIIKQRPPIKSAVARKVREREIYFFDIIEISDDRDVLFKVGCEAGTYIRKLCHDIGKALGTGAHMTELRRVRAGPFKEKQSHNMIEVRDAYEFWKEKGDEGRIRNIVIPVEYAILHVKRIFVKDSAVDSICHGSPIFPNGIARIQEGIIRGETIAVYTLKEELVALGIARMASKEMLKKDRGMAVRTDRVFMKRGTYPSK